jgi:hypothetical protein
MSRFGLSVERQAYRDGVDVAALLGERATQPRLSLF